MVRNLKATGKRYEITSGDGFVLRVSAKGKKSWVYSYWFDGKSKKMPLGHYDDTEKAEKEKDQQTIKWLANDFFERYILKNRNAPQQIEQQIEADIIPLLGKQHIEGITTRKITLALEKIVDRGSPVHANKVLSTIKQSLILTIVGGSCRLSI